MTRVLLIGGGAREHAIAWTLRRSPALSELLIAPGNGGTVALGENLPVSTTDVDGLVRTALERQADFVFVGPDDPLALGVVDALSRAGILAFGPTGAAARIEASKAFAKEVMREAGVPTASWRAFTDYQQARAYVDAHPLPVVVKADGLALGKGVAVCRTREEAHAFLRHVMVDRAFGASGERAVIEECLVGAEASVFAVADGKRALLTVPACDYKPVFDGDRGPNTGGMGSYSPSEFLSPRDIADIERRIVTPTIDRMAERGSPFRGVLYTGLMVGPQGPRVLEFNARLGDPETQVVLPRLRSDLLAIAQAAANGDLSGVRMEWTPQAAVGVVLASGGYPGEYRRGLPVAGLDEVDADVLVFHAGTKRESDGRLVTNGGRVMTVVALGDTIAQAREKAYANVSRIRFEGMHYRTDIALRAVQ